MQIYRLSRNSFCGVSYDGMVLYLYINTAGSYREKIRLYRIKSKIGGWYE